MRSLCSSGILFRRGGISSRTGWYTESMYSTVLDQPNWKKNLPFYVLFVCHSVVKSYITLFVLLDTGSDKTFSRNNEDYIIFSSLYIFVYWISQRFYCLYNCTNDGYDRCNGCLFTLLFVNQCAKNVNKCYIHAIDFGLSHLNLRFTAMI